MPVKKITKIKLTDQKRYLYRFEDFQPLSLVDYSNIYSIESPLHIGKTYRKTNAVMMSEKAKSDQFYTEGESITIDGPVYLFDMTGFAYFHALYDKVLEYEFIKTYIPNLKIIPITYSHKDLDAGNRVYEDFLNLYGLSFSDRINMNDGKNYIFKDLYCFIFEHNEFMMPFKEDPLRTVYLDGWTDPDSYKNYIKISSDSFLKKIENHLVTNQNRKIFISRKKINDQRRGLSKNHINTVYENRFIRLEDELYLEDFFRTMGYEIVFAEDYTFLEQVSLYSGASHIAGLKSSGFCNMMFSKPGTQVISINLDDSFQCWYKAMADCFDIRYIEIPSLRGEGPGTLHQMTIFPQNSTDYSMEYIVDLLKGPHRVTVGMV